MRVSVHVDPVAPSKVIIDQSPWSVQSLCRAMLTRH